MKCPKCQTDNPETASFCADCGTQLISSEEISAPTETLEAAKEELTTGSTFADRYQIIEELGKGGMGKVYRVIDKKLKEEVALKLIKPEIGSDKKTVERFSNELKLARKIVHKNVARMFDLNEEKGNHYITMEYVPGEDLKRLIRKVGQLGSGKTISIAIQVCEGLAEAHRLGVVHRDLKPNNVMIDEEGNVRIMDFGIARSLEEKGITGAGMMIGTPEYMSPEQVEGKKVDQRSDIYSLGIILYEMVTGRVPFEGETPFSIAFKHKSETPRNPKEVNAQIPEDLSRVILRCLEKDKELRYQSAGEVRSELENIEKGIPTTERVVPERKPVTSREITVTFGLRKLFIPALAVVAAAVIGVLIWQLLPKKPVIPILSDKPSLAIMYFENNTGEDGLEHYRKALSDLLITDLSQSKFINVLRGDRLFNILSQLNQLEAKSYSSDVLREVAHRGRVNHILQGNYTKAGENFRINIMLHDANTEELLSSESVEGRGEESIFSMVDELTRKIKTNFKLSREQIASDIDLEVGKITTSSPEAYKYYSEGRKHHNSGAYRKSILLMERAIAVDPEFAMAYRSMGMAYSNLGYRVERIKYLQKAFEFRDRLSDRESYIIQGDFYGFSEATYNKAIEAFNQLLQLYPTDGIGNINLAGLYRNLEEWDKAIDRNEILIQDGDESFYPYVGQAIALAAKGLYDRAMKVLESYLHNFSDNGYIRWALAHGYLYQGKFDLALAEAERAISLMPSFGDAFWLKGYIYLCKGDLIEAEKEFQKLLESEEKSDNLSGRQGFLSLRLLQGRFEEAKDQANQGMELAEELGEMGWKSYFHISLCYLNLRLRNLDRALQESRMAFDIAYEEEMLGYQRVALSWNVFIYLEMKSIEKAREAADKLMEIIDRGMNRKLLRMYHVAEGMIELKSNNLTQAIKNFEAALALVPYQYELDAEHALFIDSLALAYYRANELDKALTEYEKITSLTGGRTLWGDIYAKSFYMLGKIYEQQGNNTKAIEHYEKFLDLWKDADPGIAEVDTLREDAKKRLAGLRGQ